MSESQFKLYFEGPNSEEKAQQVSSFIEKEFAHKPAILKDMPHKQEGVRFDPMMAIEIATAIVALPSALLKTADLIKRMTTKKKVDDLITLAKRLQKEDPDFRITISKPDGTTMMLGKVSSEEILDAVGE